MSRSANYTKIGVFITVGIALLVAIMIMLGVGKYFQKTFLMETYINESVNGMSQGSALKFKGVQIGRVKEIGFVMDSYNDFMNSTYRYVTVVCELDMKYFPNLSIEEIDKVFQHEIDMGLRVRLVSQGLTGQQFLELDYLPQADNPKLPINWTPKYLYVPSAPSMMSRVEGAVSSISAALKNFQDADIAGTINTIRDVATTVNKLMKESNATGIQNLVAENLMEFKTTLESINAIIASPGTKNLVPEAAQILTKVRTILDQTDQAIISTINDLSVTARYASNATRAVNELVNSPGAQKAAGEVGQTMENISNATRQVGSAAIKLNSMINRLNSLVAGQQTNLRLIMENTKVLMENLRELSDEAKRYPAGVLFGNPPSKAQPEK